MRFVRLSQLMAMVAILSISVTAGCNSDRAEETSPAQSGHFAGDGHDHSAQPAGHFPGDGHDHGDQAQTSHPTEGPHGGDLIELGDEEYHAELLHDEDTHTVTVHLLDGQGKEPVNVPAGEVTVQLFQDGKFVKYTLQAVPATGTSNRASQFKLVDAALCDTLCHGEEVRGRLQVTIGGKSYNGTIEHGSHGTHDHGADEHAGH